eukprot:EG_transcript_9934
MSSIIPDAATVSFDESFPDSHRRGTGGYDTFNRVFGRDHDLVSGYGTHGHATSSPTRSTHGYAGSTHSGRLAHTPVHGEVIHEEPTPVKYGERSVKKLVQVPVTREVKVPTTIEKVVETVEVKEIPVSKVRQEHAFKKVEEEYVDFEEREVTRYKEVWVKQQIPEKHIERVPVKKVRTVEVPYVVAKPYTEVQRVEIPVTKVVEHPGYRVDEVVEYETREVEGKQKVEWIPHVVDEWSEERDLGVRDRHIVERKVGRVIFPDTEAGHSHVHGHLDGHSHAYSLGHEHSHSHGVDHEAREVHAHHAHSAAGGSPVRLLFNGMHSEGPPSPGGVAASTTAAGGDSHFGLFVRESVVGLVVKSVLPGSPAAHGGIVAGDIITSVDGLEVYSIEELRRAIGRKTAVTVAYRSKQLGRRLKVHLSH